MICLQATIPRPGFPADDEPWQAPSGGQISTASFSLNCGQQIWASVNAGKRQIKKKKSGINLPAVFPAVEKKLPLSVFGE
jgi:hypothetical protein